MFAVYSKPHLAELCCCCLDVQAVYHVAPGPEAWPALARCTALAELSLVLPDPALADHFGTLPPSLTHLKASGVDTLEVLKSPRFTLQRLSAS